MTSVEEDAGEYCPRGAILVPPGKHPMSSNGDRDQPRHLANPAPPHPAANSKVGFPPRMAQYRVFASKGQAEEQKYRKP
jgi:hypothetical protein